MFTRRLILLGALFFHAIILHSLFGQSNPWFVYYERAIHQIERGAYQEAITNLHAAVRLKEKPQRAAPAVTRAIDYFPYFYLGTAHFYQARMDSALYFYDKSEQYGELKDSEFHRILLASRKIAEDFITTGATARRQVAMKDSLLTIVDLIGKNEFERAKTSIDALLMLNNQDPKIKRIAQWIELEITRRNPNKESAQVQDTGNEKKKSTQIKFEAGLGYYLRGDFSRARENFEEVLREDPKYTLAAGLISKIKSESAVPQKNSMPPVLSDTVRITSTSEPSLAVSPFDSRTKQDTLILKGRASDDVGIGFIQFSINGTSSIIYPKSSKENRTFEFSQPIPLKVGPNSIQVNVYDKENPPRSFFEDYTIERYIPWYQKSEIVVLLVLIPAVVFLFLWIKKVTIKIEDIPNPYVFGPPIENKDRFYGREKFLQRIEEALHRSSVVIQGERRIGKTSLLRQLKNRLKSPMYPISLSMEQIMSESTFLRDLALGILRESSEHLFDITEEHENRIKQKGSAYGSHDLFDDLAWVIEKFKELDPQAMLVILIDEIDQTNNWDPNLQQNLRGIFLQDTADVRLVLAGVRIVDRVLDDKTSPWYNPCRHFVLEPLTEGECQELITAPAKGFHYDEEALKHIMSMTQCKPHFVQMTCSFAFEIAQRQRTKDITYLMAQKAFDQAVEEYSTVMKAVWAKLPVELRRTFELANPINSFKYTLEINRLAELSLCSRNPLNRKVAPSPIFERWIERSQNE